MNRLFLTIIIAQFTVFATAQNYHVVDETSSVKFIIQNAGMATDGKFTGLEGSIVFNPATLKTSTISVTIDASTVNTEIDVRDNALRSADYLDTKKYPEFSFTSKQILATDKANRFMLKGIITIKGISKDITFPFFVKQMNDGIQLTGDIKLNRRDFKIATGSLVLSDMIIVSLSVFAKKD